MGVNRIGKDLTSGDSEYSGTRPGERLWEQLLRNIQSHHTNSNNFISLGYLDHIKAVAIQSPTKVESF